MFDNSILVIYFIIINLITFFIYGIDKYKAKKELWRIPEKVLISFAFFGGSIGALFGMKIWHHKTKKMKFIILVPLSLIIYVVAIVCFLEIGI
ncbi:Uncharacterized membrane protein YsdA, DUF1294 family [Lachnospiraceae bacterium RM5]|nr:Uncharacterized membrane protein YsdA, DUF1294 family [Lachnospiraceae bacterium RM5]